VAEIARGCGFIQMVDGPGERHLPVSLRAVRGRFLCWRVRRFHPFAARNGFNPNKRVGNDMRKCSKLRGLSDAYNFFLRGPKEGRSIRSAKASAVSSGFGCCVRLMAEMRDSVAQRNVGDLYQSNFSEIQIRINFDL
jgi:hypothetical protein